MNIEKMFFDTVTELKEAGLDWNPKPLQSASGPTAIIEGKEQILLCANNYLGLSNRMELKKAAIEATEKYGAGSGSVRAIAGTMELHKELEKKIAHYKETDAALYYQSGFTVNSGLLPAVLTKGWIVISDELNHGSIIDGVRLSKADKMIFPHRNMEELRKQLQKAQKQNPIGILIATDGVFSM
ncbi:aminotransferase class I/II-fold pyridoxal phosphate-dependent enzyme, partial [Candidatus Micrarchaeota archaeon]|nr:aminotransferase class I/II-fold pyridoxal phosphate-dependent enzyme [Candidatus Micrarchaeota archaeon]